MPQQQQNEAHLSKRRRSRSRKRDESRGRSASRGRSTDGNRSENMNYNRNQQRPGNVISWAQASNPQAANRNPLNHVDQAKDNTVQSLHNENDQLKRCIAEQRAQMQEMNAKLNQLINAQQQQQATPTPPPSSPQIQPRPPTPTENNTNSAMISEQAPKKRALEHARERRVNVRLDSLEERQDRLEQTMKANYETLSQAIKATKDRLDATNARLERLVTPVLCEAPSARTVGKGAGQGVCPLVKKNLTSIDHELLPNGAIEHTTVEIITGKRKRRESTYTINVYSNPKHFQQKFRTLVHKAQQLAGSNVTPLCGEFNAQHTAWGYPYTTAKGHGLYDETMDADTNTDLAFISTASELRGVTWRNTGETLGSDHSILEITIPLAESTQRAQLRHIVDWHEYRKKLEDNVTETIEDIEAWANMLNATTKDAIQTVEAEPEATMLDSRLAHLMEARNSLRRRWKRQRHNRKLRKRIAQLNRHIEHHSAVLCRQQWHAVCQEADGQLHKGKTWRLLRHLLNDKTTKGAQHYMLNKTIHKAVKEIGKAEVQRRLDAKYLPGHTNDPRAYYVDVAKYPHRPSTYAAAVIAADTGVLTTSGSIRCKSATQAEEFAIALALAIPNCRTVLSDLKPAIVNFATNVHGTTARVCSTIARPETNITVKWFPAHAGELDAGPNRKEEADTDAHAQLATGLRQRIPRSRNDPMPKTKSVPSQPTATFCSGTERADASTQCLTETYNAAKQPQYGSCKYKPYGSPSGQSTFARRAEEEPALAERRHKLSRERARQLQVLIPPFESLKPHKFVSMEQKSPSSWSNALCHIDGLRAVEFSMCDVSSRMHCLAERRSKIGQTVRGKYANAMRVSNSIAAATARPTFFRFISFETPAPNLRETVPKGDAASVRVVRSTPGKQRRSARVAVASVSTVRD
ncbi:hypothetical protein HPB50_007694 [Hyalomma asiaticum]|uniref:Uncharacterized protein n=1 Tax=Hyalomma asiaticum TaxID=266040 RepID=A0ACB7SLX2_HYAAI|nr:hypothetical protein HPB50_007694 [Hyalomma asiaticum]